MNNRTYTVLRNKFIARAVSYADKKTEALKSKTEELNDYWNQLYHGKMNELWKTEGALIGDAVSKKTLAKIDELVQLMIQENLSANRFMRNKINISAIRKQGIGSAKSLKHYFDKNQAMIDEHNQSMGFKCKRANNAD